MVCCRRWIYEGVMMSDRKIIIAVPHGFCAGVSRAIETVEKVLEKFPSETVYVLHEVVHNQHVVDDLRQKGVVFTDCLADIPENSIVVFSAHGVSADVEELARMRNLRVYDATCPIVDRVHRKVRRLSSQGEEVIMIGHAGHQEVVGTLGQYNSEAGGIYLVVNHHDIENLKVKNPAKLSFVTQTTLSVDETAATIRELQSCFPGIQGPGLNDICYATQNRQRAVKELAKKADVVLVVGSRNSSNSNRLREVAEHEGAKAFLINDHTELLPEMITGYRVIGITGGASAPEYLLKDLVRELRNFGYEDIEELGVSTEKQKFRLPGDL